MVPILYSFRRCPYAMRARLVMYLTQTPYEHREILLRDKPKHMLEISPKGTVPVLQLPHGDVIDESLDIMIWALKEVDHAMLGLLSESMDLIQLNDHEFKKNLDRFKYPTRYAEEGEEAAVRQQALQGSYKFLDVLEARLSQNIYLLNNDISIADLAIFPFVRQFSKVDEKLWVNNNYPKTQAWLAKLLVSELFNSIMNKHKVWAEGDEPLLIHTV